MATRVAANIKELREDRRFSLRDLSERMTEVGRPILPSGLSKLENGDRRADVDDLVALALALDTTPNRLLLPGPREGGSYTEADAELADGYTVPQEAGWEWARGEWPLPESLDGTRSGYEDVVRDSAASLRLQRFYHENRQYGKVVALAGLSKEEVSMLAPIAAAYWEVHTRAHLTVEIVFEYVRMIDHINHAAAREHQHQQEGRADG